MNEEESFEDDNYTEMGVGNLTVQENPYDPIFEFWVPGVFLNSIGFLGLIGNSLSIFVLSRPQMKNSINCLLLGLATFDIILIWSSILMCGIPHIYNYRHLVKVEEMPYLTEYMQNIFPIITPVVYPIGMLAQTGSVYLTVCVTLERYVAVCRPLKAKSICTYRRAKIAVAVTTLMAIVYNLPRFFEISRKQVYYPDIEKYQNDVEPTELRQNKYYIWIYVNWMYLIFLYLIPFGLLAIYNTLIYREIRRTDVIRAELSRNQKRELGLAVMLLCVVIVFFLCNVLALVVNILEHFDKVVVAITQTSNLLVTLNSSVNFTIYCIFGDKFKKVFLATLCRKKYQTPAELERRITRQSLNHDKMIEMQPAIGNVRTSLLPKDQSPQVLQKNDGNRPRHLLLRQYQRSDSLDSSDTNSPPPARTSTNIKFWKKKSNQVNHHGERSRSNNFSFESDELNAYLHQNLKKGSAASGRGQASTAAARKTGAACTVSVDSGKDNGVASSKVDQAESVRSTTLESIGNGGLSPKLVDAQEASGSISPEANGQIGISKNNKLKEGCDGKGAEGNGGHQEAGGGSGNILPSRPGLGSTTKDQKAKPTSSQENVGAAVVQQKITAEVNGGPVQTEIDQSTIGRAENGKPHFQIDSFLTVDSFWPAANSSHLDPSREDSNSWTRYKSNSLRHCLSPMPNGFNSPTGRSVVVDDGRTNGMPRSSTFDNHSS